MVVKRARSALAAVEARTSSGTRLYPAFCIDKTGVFVASDAVVWSALEHGKVRLVLGPGGEDQQVVSATILRCSDNPGVAILKIDPPRPLVALELGRNEDIRETLPVLVFGFSHKQPLNPEGPAARDVTVAHARITSRKSSKQGLTEVQIDGLLNPGYTGGPVLDSLGRVLGIVKGGLLPAQINFAIPVGRLSDYLTTPLVIFEPPPVDLGDRFRSIDWTLKLQPAVSGTKLPADLAVSVTVPAGPGGPRTVSARAAGAGVYTARVIPLQGAPDRLVTLAVQSSTINLIGVTPDLPIRIGGKASTLGDVRSIRMSRPPHVVLRDDTVLKGEILGLRQVEVLTEVGPMRIDLRRVRTLDVLKVGEIAGTGSLRVDIQVRRGATSLCREIRRVEIQGAPEAAQMRSKAGLGGGSPRPLPTTAGSVTPDAGAQISGVLGVSGALGSARSIHPPKVAIPEAVLAPGMAKDPSSEPRQSSSAPKILAQTAHTVMLPSKIRDITPAGGGRYLLLTMRDPYRLAIFDVNVADVIKTLALPSERVLVAGGGEKFVLVFPDRSAIERWDLATLTREESSTVPIRPKIVNIAMGSDSSGPLLAELDIDLAGLPLRSGSHWCFIDPVSLNVLKVGEVVSSSTFGDPDGLSPGGGVVSLTIRTHRDDTLRTTIRASDDGSLFLIGDRLPGSSGKLLNLSLGVVKTRNLPLPSPLLPGPDGQYLYVASPNMERAAVTDLVGNRIFEPSAAQRRNLLFLPTSVPAYFLSIGGLTLNGLPPNVPQNYPPLTLTLHAAGSLTPLANIEKLPEMHFLNPVGGDWQEKSPAFEYRFRWIPAAELLITVPSTDDRLVLRRLRLANVIATSGPETLYVTSAKSLLVRAGKKLSHRIEVKSAKGGVKLTLTKGPEGLKLTPDGRVEWDVPDRGENLEETAVITIENESGHPLFHKLTIRASKE